MSSAQFQLNMQGSRRWQEKRNRLKQTSSHSMRTTVEAQSDVKSASKNLPAQPHEMAETDKSATVAGFNYDETVKCLNKWYRIVRHQLLRHQSPITGLFPVDPGRNPTEAHVRDSTYCAVALWALAQSYKRIDDDKGRTHELAQSAVKCMRGILACWIRQASKVEKFKKSQSPKNALHSKFHVHTQDPIATEEEYDHLQLDCIALYLIFLVQMITSGLQIIFTTDEVNFIQNLVFYVERAYRTPDYGMWERGSKYNNGSSELNASSIGMAKAALEAVNGSNLFGDIGSNWSVAFIDIDAHYRNRTNFDSLLPRESASKNTDASLIPTVSWPAFAIHEETLVHRTMDKIKRKLRGKYGFKRFLRDGFGTVMEDKNRRHYRPAEIKNFDGIECEWPIFFAYMIIDGVFRGRQDRVELYQNLLKPLLREGDIGDIMPRYYWVPGDCIDEERASHGSQTRLHSGEGDSGSMFMWGQAVYIISQLLVEGLLNMHELDPIRRYLPAAERPRPNSRYSSFQSSPTDLVIQVVLLAESVSLQQMLATYGIQTQTPHQIEPMQIWPPSLLVKAYEQLGVNPKLGLTGRPSRPIGGLGTAKIYRTSGYTFLCYPLLFEVSDFYISHDMELVIDDVKSDLRFLGKCWKLAGRPTFCMLIREENIRGPNAKHLFELLANFKRGDCDGIKVRLGRLQEFISSACIEHLDFLYINPDEANIYKPITEKDAGQQFRSLTNLSTKSLIEEQEFTWTNYDELQHQSTWDLIQRYHSSDNPYCKAQILQVLLNREGLYYRFDDKTVEDRLQTMLNTCATNQVWAVVRFCSSLLGKVVDSLAPSITAILVRGKQMAIGVYGHEEEVIDKPLSPQEIKNILYSKCFPHDLPQAVLQQELILNIGKYISTSPRLFDGILTIRIGWLVQAMNLELKYTHHGKVDGLNHLSPSAIKKLLYQVISKTVPKGKRSVIWNRQLDGALNRVPPAFYDRVWQILERTPGGLKVAGYLLPQQPTLSDMTQYELNFSLLVEQMLSKIVDPAYRQIMVESFMVVSTILERNPELSFKKPVEMDKLVHVAFDLFQRDMNRTSGEEKTDNMNMFYNTPPDVAHGTTSYIARAIVEQLLDGEVEQFDHTKCCVS